MKKFVVSMLMCISILTVFTITSFAAEIVLFTPSEQESELAPTRDFYVIGKIDRKGQNASGMPLNVKIELIDENGTVVRSVKSDVSQIGVTSAEHFLLDYEQGIAMNDAKGGGMNLFTPPDIIYDGIDRNSIRSVRNKIVVKDSYFSAVIYGGATKDFDLHYYDEEEKALSDISKGKYKIVVTALSLEDEEVCTYEKSLVFSDDKGRVVASDDSLVELYAKENDLTLNSSFPGKWVPSDFMKAPDDFSYTINPRFWGNLSAEYGKAKNISVLLYNLNPDEDDLNVKLGSAFASGAKRDFLFYDIGEKEVDFNFNGAKLTKEGSIVRSDKQEFIKLLRSETYNDEDLYADFNSDDGFVLTKGNTSVFYGVFSPHLSATLSDSMMYSLNEKVSSVKYILSDNKMKTLHEGTTAIFIIRNGADPARYEFKFDITPDENMTDAKYLTLSLLDKDGKEIFSESPIGIKVNRSGDFISGYDNKYWGKSFCDVINALGQTPEGIALAPDEFITRGDFAAMINRLFGFGITKKATFSDLDFDSVYYNDCATAQAIGYMTGDEHSRVKADGFITREQAMIILARISKAEAGDKSVKFKDDEKISFWAKDYVDVMSSNGIVSGFEGYLNPTNSITTAEASALIIKTFKWMYGEVSESVLPEKEEVSDELKDTEVADTEFISIIDLDSATSFLEANYETLNSLTEHIQRNYKDGLYINRVGKGLEVRDYKRGDFVKLSEDALRITTTLSAKFAEFSSRYNPSDEDAVHFILGRDEEGRIKGLTYIKGEEAKNKILTPVDGYWYYFIRK